MPNLGKPIAQLPKDMGEAVVKPAVDEAMNVLNDIPATIFGGTTAQKPPPNPAVEAQKKADDEKRRQNILRYFETLKANAAAYQQQKNFTEQQKKQAELAEEQKVRQFDIQAKQKKDETVFRAQRKTE